MKYYAEFYQDNTTKWDNKINKLVSVEPYKSAMCGSDSVLILDGRLNIYSMVSEAKKQIESLKSVKSNITGFKIYKANGFNDKYQKQIYSSF